VTRIRTACALFWRPSTRSIPLGYLSRRRTTGRGVARTSRGVPPRVLPLLDADERRDGEALLQEVETLTGFTPSLVHCDLEACHLLVREGRLAGVIDWAGARIGDPALDYGWLLNGPFPNWDVDEELRRRASLYYRFGPWFAVEYGLRTEQPEWLRSGLENLRARL
jgi:hypothetical protein